ncbi:outer membrane lipoprotein carrier protein LolA [Lichenihabitans sp. Uapishka_5]|nr:outer membrane lipoprotein carrier protein LolA [Lichenihabitans sp. Uapishka_5]
MALLPFAVADAETAPLQLQPTVRKSSKAAPAPAVPALAPEEVIAKANDYFNSAGTMQADFTQIGGDGRRSDGKLFLDRPGRMRFTYAPPATLEVIADGTSVAVIDRKLHTQDLYFIAQTPLKFLLKDHVNLGEDARILDVTSDKNDASILIEDQQTFGGTSRIRLTFSIEPFALRQWTIMDPQGYETMVSLADLDLVTKPDPALFRISSERMLNSRN